MLSFPFYWGSLLTFHRSAGQSRFVIRQHQSKHWLTNRTFSWFLRLSLIIFGIMQLVCSRLWWCSGPGRVFLLVSITSLRSTTSPYVSNPRSWHFWVWSLGFNAITTREWGSNSSNCSSKKLTAIRNGASTDHSSSFYPSQPSWEVFKQV